MLIGTFRRSLLTPHLVMWVLLSAALFDLSFGAIAAANVTATVNRNVITLGETVTLSINVEGAQVQQPALPPIPNFQVVGTGQTFQSINGAIQLAFTYELSPSKAGDLVIPAMQLNVGGQASRTQPIAIKVLPSGATPGGGPALALAKIILPKTNVYVGEVLDLEVQIYFQEGRLTQYPQLPADSGFTVGKWLKPADPTRVALSNAAYYFISFKAPITAVKAGALTVGPATEPLIVPDRSRPRGFFFQNEREIRVNAEQVTAVALPLPQANVPATFAGAVGQYTVAMTAAPTTVAAGDPITVRVQVNGHGWLDAVTLPNQPQWREFKMYTPNAKIESADPNNVNGTKTFEIAMVPQNPGIKLLPPFAFSYFDPEAGGYRTATAPGIPLNVTAAANPATALPRLIATNSAAPQVTDLAHLKVHLGSATAAVPLLARPWFLLLQGVAPVIWLGLLIFRKRSEALANNPRLRRRREVQAFVRDATTELRTHAAANQSDAFFATLTRALQEQIGERLDIPAHSVTEAVVSDRLRPAGLSEETCRALDELFQAANLARYAPVKTSQELTAWVDRADAALRAVQAWENKP